jgi:ubiquinone/menaquinone biosynthesis C-methylase UbiE
LDLGSGDGKIAKLLFDGQFTYGVDNGEANDYQESIKNKVYKKVLLESAEEMSLPDKSVNFVFSNSVIEHIPDNEAVLSEVSRILKKDGRFVFTSPSDQFREYLFGSHLLNRLNLTGAAQKYSKSRNDKLNHYHLYSLEEWTKKLRKHRLKVVDHGYYIPREALLLWDRMALEIYINKTIGRNIEDKLSDKYFTMISRFYNISMPSGQHGASIFIHAVKG